ncbi:hypothetical protein DPX16_2225 [Anabarilius grahami]|uniref:Uncharacterized protein n=1 Tax=Anabarilius grahami TaxID=495550 RepID=A0A3N0YE61_ANAGA|nr:hypothetical protein DPX16_2225 [Anabarilius grahami]
MQNLATTLDDVFADFPLELESCSSFDSFEDAQVEPSSGAVMSTTITVVKHVIRELIVALQHCMSRGEDEPLLIRAVRKYAEWAITDDICWMCWSRE